VLLAFVVWISAIVLIGILAIVALIYLFSDAKRT
jgi:hypothetical protein